ncbi:MAG: glycoside hydrolase family 127 protein [Oscillospiraceae bacterium]|nr:glycoside hydrolase family 127 protein [Oscillospiraceae bacterium]
MKWDFFTTKELKPKGWLRRQLEIQAEGLSGNLDKMWPDVRDSAWIGGKREGWERVPYWLDGFIPLAYLLENEDMIARAKKYIDAILAAQQEDGWICPCTKEERPAYDPWAVLLISKVLTVYYECSGDERIPKVLCRVMKNFHDLLESGEISLFNWGKFRWFEGFVALNFLASRYDAPWIRELGRILKAQGADYNEFIPLWKRPLNYWRWDTHIVNLMMMLKHEAVSAELLGEEYTDNAETLLSVLDEYNGTAAGLITGDECLSGRSPIQGTELCAVVEQMYSYEQLFAATGDAKWVERLETVAFNGLPASVSGDMWTHQYVQQANQMSCEKFPGKSLFRTNGQEAHLFGLEPNYGCCTANFNQGWPKFALSAFMHKGDRIISCVPVPSAVKTEMGCVALETNYPFENRFVYTVEAKKDFVLVLRVPSFAKNALLDGKPAVPGMTEISLKAGECRKISLSFETEAYMEERPNGMQTAKMGSLVFSLPVKAEKKMLEYEREGVERKFPYCDYELSPVSEWNYGFAGDELLPEYRDVGEIPFSEDAPPVVLKVKAAKINWGLEEGYENICAKIPESRTAIEAPETVELWPYGCAKLRMTEMPMVK